MTEKGSLRLHRIIDIFVAITIVLAGICLALGCCYIYFSADLTYSREAVADVFEIICLPVYLCLFFVVLGFLAELLLPNAKPKSKAAISSENTVNIILKKRNISTFDDGILAVHYREKGKRTVNSMIMLILTVIACSVFFTYALDGDNFDNVDINGSVISALCVLIPCLAVPFLFYLYLLIDKERGYKRELTALKAVSEKSDAKCEYKPKFENFDIFAHTVGRFFENAFSGKPLIAVRIAIITAALLCLAFGLIFGGTADVFTKASNICTECIGLG